MRPVDLTRLSAQLLAGEPARSVREVVSRLVAVQSQELRAGLLGVRARSTGLAASSVRQALADREVVVTWVNRGTLHLVCAEDHAWLHAVTTPQLVTTNATRLRQEGVSPDQAETGVRTIRALLESGPATRSQVREALAARGVPVAGQALVHVLVKATLEGWVVRGPMLGTQQGFVLVSDWLGPQPKVDRDVALGELGHRYLAAHGPSTDRDLAKWAGVTLGDARRALAGLTHAVETGADRGPVLLGPWDEVLCGWASRDDVLGGNSSVVTSNGIFKPIALVDGVAVATWSVPTGALAPFAPLPGDVRRALATDYVDVRRFLADWGATDETRP
jgi:hypothetical protein